MAKSSSVLTSLGKMHQRFLRVVVGGGWGEVCLGVGGGPLGARGACTKEVKTRRSRPRHLGGVVVDMVQDPPQCLCKRSMVGGCSFNPPKRGLSYVKIGPLDRP